MKNFFCLGVLGLFAAVVSGCSESRTPPTESMHSTVSRNDNVSSMSNGISTSMNSMNSTDSMKGDSKMVDATMSDRTMVQADGAMQGQKMMQP